MTVSPSKPSWSATLISMTLRDAADPTSTLVRIDTEYKEGTPTSYPARRGSPETMRPVGAFIRTSCKPFDSCDRMSLRTPRPVASAWKFGRRPRHWLGRFGPLTAPREWA